MNYKFWIGLFASLQGCYAASPAFSGTHPWLTGPLLTPSARIVEVGHFLLEPYWFTTFITGRYLDDSSVLKIPTITQLNPFLIVKVGMTEKMTFATILQGFVNTTQNRTSVSFGDLPIGFEFELYNDGNNFVKFSIQELFPTGKFQKLESDKFGTDAGGQGSFVTLPSLAFGKVLHLEGVHYVSLRLNLIAGFGSSFHVKGFNVYGGDSTTYGKIIPGISLALLTSAEYTLTENWALSFDLVGLYTGSDRFKGTTIIPTGFPPSFNLSIAPAIEYNWNEHIGLITGVWLTLAGRNSNQYTSFVTALNIYY